MVSENKKRVQITLSGYMLEKLETLADERGLSKSMMIEFALDYYLQRKGNHDA
ncbi:CopG family transcriptional regulator [Streptococcus suis]|uniref:ribbon-helix-helix domain-containing protein n=1 Tax=Streptococcus suis TaxID=1307 RepID=UPI000CF40B2E|nr:CopG family transcriptional regulator [Streptococcus suis]